MHSTLTELVTIIVIKDEQVLKTPLMKHGKQLLKKKYFNVPSIHFEMQYKVVGDEL